MHALSPDDFEAWVAGKKRQIKQADAAAAISRKRLEANPTGNP